MGMTPEYIANLKKAVDNFKNKGEMAKIASKAGAFYDFDINIINPDPNQPRKNFDETALQELADDIKKNGLIQPIVVRDDLEHPGKFIVVAGERRLKAAKMAGLTKIRSIVGTYDDSQLGYVQIAENAKRDDLKFYELAEFIVSRSELGEKQTEIAEKLGISKSQLSLYMIWKDAPEFLKAAKDKFSSIRTFFDVAKLADEFSSDVETFIENSDSEISRADIAALKKKLTSPEETPDAEDNSEESTDATYISSDYEIANDEEQPSEGSDIFDDSSSESASDDGTGDEELSSEDTEEDSETSFNDSSEDENSEESTSDYQDDAFSGVDTSFNDESEDLSDADFESDDTEEKSKKLKHPVFVGTVDGREAEIVMEMPTTDGRVKVKYEDGSLDEVLCENFILNRIYES